MADQTSDQADVQNDQPNQPTQPETPEKAIAAAAAAAIKKGKSSLAAQSQGSSTTQVQPETVANPDPLERLLNTMMELNEEEIEGSRTYEEVEDHENIVVQVGPRVQVQSGQVNELESKRFVQMSKYAYELLERDDHGRTKVQPVVAVGLPLITEVHDPKVSGGIRKELSFIPFANALEVAQ